MSEQINNNRRRDNNGANQQRPQNKTNQANKNNQVGKSDVVAQSNTAVKDSKIVEKTPQPVKQQPVKQQPVKQNNTASQNNVDNQTSVNTQNNVNKGQQTNKRQNNRVRVPLPEREVSGDNYKNDVPVAPVVRAVEQTSLRVGITHGDFNGINYEIFFKGLFNRTLLDICKPIVYGHSKIAADFKKRVGMSEFGFSFIKSIDQAKGNAVCLINVSDKDCPIEIGKVSKVAGEMAYLALEAAVKDIKNNKIDVLVTAPINKESINQSVDFNFPGHTEYLADRFQADKTLMLMVADNLRVAVATNHVPVDSLKKVITKELIMDKVQTLSNSLKRDFAIDMPKIAVLSLNPHAGDGGVIGNEEMDVILPAVTALKNSGMIVNGPFAADGFFSSPSIYGKYDAVLAMYHDQGMIPFKMIAGDMGVNFTAGLPIVRTSPAHGTAFDIAGQNIASHSMLLEAIFMACDIYRNRKEYDTLTANRLR